MSTKKHTIGYFIDIRFVQNYLTRQNKTVNNMTPCIAVSHLSWKLI